MKLAILILSFTSCAAFAGPLGALKSINCQYIEKGGNVKHPVVHLHNETVPVQGAEDEFDKIVKMTVSVAYIMNGTRTVENATVLSWQVQGPDGDFNSLVTATGDKSKRNIQIHFKNFGGKSTMDVDGRAQIHMTGLTCSLGLGA